MPEMLDPLERRHVQVPIGPGQSLGRGQGVESKVKATRESDFDRRARCPGPPPGETMRRRSRDFFDPSSRLMERSHSKLASRVAQFGSHAKPFCRLSGIPDDGLAKSRKKVPAQFHLSVREPLDGRLFVPADRRLIIRWPPRAAVVQQAHAKLANDVAQITGLGVKRQGFIHVAIHTQSIFVQYAQADHGRGIP